MTILWEFNEKLPNKLALMGDCPVIQSFDAVIVGGGIVGAACALAFSRSGMRLALVERAEIGGGATAAAMGHIVVLDDSPAQLALTRYSQLLWQQMASPLPPDAEYTPRGTLWVAADDEE